MSATRSCLGCGGRGFYGACGTSGTDYCECSCYICLGSGQVEAKPGMRDAMADAETLRPLVEVTARAAGNIHYWGKTADWSHVDVAAYDDARAVFRAVPGLRGDK